MFEVEWTGRYPSLCYGEWKISKNGEDVSHFIPEDLRHSSMGTFGTYQRWHFEAWLEVFDSYEDGLTANHWINRNFSWICKFCRSKAEMKELYQAINKKDWRHGSCGGCI